jgi:hypothetical protein
MPRRNDIQKILVIRAGARLRWFLNGVFFLALVLGWSRATTAFAMDCPAPGEITLKRMQGIIYGPSGEPVPGITVRISRAGKQIAQTQTDEGGRFKFNTGKGEYDVRAEFARIKTFDVKARVVGGVFHPSRLFIVMALSGTRCSFATSSSKQLKQEIQHYQHQLREIQH